MVQIGENRLFGLLDASMSALRHGSETYINNPNYGYQPLRSSVKTVVVSHRKY